ncbi:peptidoglycan glycosyltransferase FtsI [Photobacterium kishitanii]|uniref:Peptidoglycan D,D-transpeptidase FtsI n=1 Tax=Photobacterium kishitanii TaxID=318456 RepID=A0A0B7J4Q9_9GAMM|nr:penicillin-binding transpeptidase domain-containing protein [Photobacterium kishitanii]OBU28612.1 peptidoglycan glycosyltransferase FtsI [Photobacterium kishitanii]PSU87761.1 peptidoglycan glycosyltransferase FtsI [Photobacterium kishitanii]PSU93368.1 peptidoglycan glycosyltransferase FtsI [Photobacterium kishitanii]PSU94794.1 peptidoglycan glycosyltransferase FtsI [Photobacterium kishitanii]PSV24427.1 peptidoglycan glycosyltransferase FtsI [Photobacterium kishitanii]
MKLFNRSNKNTKVSPKSTPFLKWRFMIICGFILLGFFGLIARAAYIQVLEPGRLIQEGDARSLRVQLMPSARGIISDRNGEQLAVSVPVQAVFANPVEIFKHGGLSETKRWNALADVLDLDRTKLLQRLEKNKNRKFIYLARQVSPPMANYVEKLKLPGIGLRAESRRFYPSGEVSAQLIGFTGIDGHGLDGIEKTYDGWLTGEPGRRTVRKDRYGRVVENISQQSRQPGKPLELSIDQRIQAIAYRAAKEGVMDIPATSVSIAISDVRTGEILAMVNAPSFNPNDRNDRQPYKMRNRVITDTFEPGSTVKPFVVYTALKNGVVNEHTLINIPQSKHFRVGSKVITDVSRIEPLATVQRILQKSSNIGVSKLSLAMPVEDILDTYRKVGFDEPSGINLIGETTGHFPNRYRWSDIGRATLAYGYGISLTPIQLLHAYTTLGAYGIKRPLSILKTEKVVPGEQVLDPKIAKKILLMIESVTDKAGGGGGWRAAVPGYRVGVKTGTAKKAIAGGYGNDYFSYTVGVAPISHPRLAIVVMVNEPKGDKFYGGAVAAPILSKVLGGALQILNVPPDADTLKIDK